MNCKINFESHSCRQINHRRRKHPDPTMKMNHCLIFVELFIVVIKFPCGFEIPNPLHTPFQTTVTLIKVLLLYAINPDSTSYKLIINRCCATKKVYLKFFIFQSKRSLYSNPGISTIDISKIAHYYYIFYLHRFL